MKHLALAFALITFLQADACAPQPVGQSQDGYTIRVCSERDISEIIDYNNQWLSATSIRFALADSDCDVEVIIGLNRSGVAADALPLTGRIRLGHHPDYRVSFMHEALHLAGLGHEPHDRASVMWTHAMNDPAVTRQLRPHHVEALRRLAGITPAGRVAAQIGSMK